MTPAFTVSALATANSTCSAVASVAVTVAQKPTVSSCGFTCVLQGTLRVVIRELLSLLSAQIYCIRTNIRNATTLLNWLLSYITEKHACSDDVF